MDAGEKDPSRLTDRFTRHAKPGGHVEIAEGRANFWCDDGTLPEDSYTAKWLVSLPPTPESPK